MRIQLIMDNLSSFLRLEPKLEVLSNYYKIKSKHEKLDSIGDLKESYLNEPVISSSSIAMQLNDQIKEIDNFLALLLSEGRQGCLIAR